MKTGNKFQEGLFEEKDDQPYLIGRKCTKCGNIQFPQKGFCQSCLNDELEEIEIGQKGKLFSYTTTYGRVAKRVGPFDVGYIQLDEGIRVFAPISKPEDISYEIGQDMEIEIVEVWEEDGVPQLSFGYRVVGEE